MVQRMELDAIADRKLPMKQQRMRDMEDVLYFVLDEKGHSVHLTDRGAEAMSPNDPELFLVPDISEEIHRIDKDPELSPHDRIERRRQIEADYALKSEKLHIIHKLLQAHVLYEKEVDYLVQEGQVVIVDEFTGRVMSGRRWADGLHQAVEAKEGVQVKGETQTFATITIQNYFRMYDKLAGMTGTAETEETEFYSIYGLEVSVIPTHRPIRRLDQADRIYKTRKEKHDAIMDEVERLHQLGWPVLIGTVNVDVSETLSRQLKRRGLQHEVLNAKYHQREAEIVAGAGQKAAITIATNMAGRGTDIKLGKDLDLTQPEAGLQIIGTERHESRRIDRQLRGRSGRQGDPGQSIFFLSLEDDLMRLFGSDRIARWMDKSGAEEGEVITGGLVTRAIEQAQKRVELQNFQQREAAARVRRRDEPAARGDLLAAALRAGAGRGAQGRGAADDRGGARPGGEPVPQRAPSGRRSTTVAACARRSRSSTSSPWTSCSIRRRRPTIEKMVELAKAEGERAFQRKVEYLAEFGRTIGIPEVDSAGAVAGDARGAGRAVEGPPVRSRPAAERHPVPRLGAEGSAGRVQAGSVRDVPGPDARHPVHLLRAFPQDPGDRGAAASGAADGGSQAGAADTAAGRHTPAAPAPPPLRPRALTTSSWDPPPPRGGPGRGRRAGRDQLARAGGTPGRATVPEVGRNDPCPCGSGKKYKKCHGAGK